MPTGMGHRAKPPPGSVADWKVSYQWSGIRARIPHLTTASTSEPTASAAYAPGKPMLRNTLARTWAARAPA
ncbi:hypothetical protein ACFH04_11890 [Streptomyces noboritoensis]|uniref:Uncharacterized protein n=1 Tax=Streptomyces noboritoensis TaxID=67337 RepID=A0ABV6TF29_9ACTN